MRREETVNRRVGGRYTLLEPLGRGGMGTVWRGHDELLRRDVAVKHVAVAGGRPDAPGTLGRDRVLREAQAAARLGHPASVTVYDVLEDDGSVYIVMELVEADSLAALVERAGPMPVREAARMGLQLADALEAAHRHGIVHRDVKPSNVMVLPTGGVKLTDFGIASVKDDPALTATGQVLGSPSYMAPEQALGTRSGPAADWWGLGATLYHAVEGRPPYERSGALATLSAVVNEEPAPMERAGPMAALLRRLLAKEPGDRPGAAEVRRVLRPLAEATAERPVAPPPAPGDDPATTLIAAPPPPPPAPPAPTTRAAPPPPAAPPARSPGPAAGRRALVAGAVLVALLVAVVTASFLAGDDELRQSTAPAAPPSTTAPSDAGRAGAGTSTTTAPRTSGVPEEWVSYTDPKTGYVIDHPPGWQVRPLDGTRTDIVDPATGSYLRVDWTDTPGDSPEAAWEAQSRSFGARHEDYEEIRIEPTTFKGFDAAIWEYAYSSRGARLHAVDLGMVTGRYGFALNFQTPEELWKESHATFEAFKASFRAPA